MGLLTKLLQPKAESLRNPPDWMYEAFGGQKTTAGVRVNEVTAWNISAVYACIRSISETVGSLSLVVYERKGEGKERAVKHPVYKLLHDSPNPDMTSMVFRETLQANLLSWGNAYAEIQRNGIDRPVALWPLLSSQVRPERNGSQLVYVVRSDDGTERTLKSSQVLHIPGMGFDGIVGRSPIRLAKESLGLSLASEEFGAAFFGNGAQAGGILEHPGSLNPDTIKLLRQSWEDIHKGSGNAHKVAILEEGMKFAQMTIPPNDAQFLETRKFQVEDVARWYNVPPHKIKHLERSTFNNIEHQSIEFVQDTIRPWLVRWEQEIKRKLFSRQDQNFYAEFLIDSLLRGDVNTRNDSYTKGVIGGWLSRNEVRVMENLNPVDGLDDYLIPLNMAVVGEEPEEIEPPVTNERESQMTESAANRLARKETTQVEKAVAKNMGNEKFSAWARDFYQKHSEVVAESLIVTKEKAQKYTHNTCEALVSFHNNADIAGFNRWNDNRYSELKNLPYDIDDKETQVFVNITQAQQETPIVNIDNKQDAPIVNIDNKQEPSIVNVDFMAETPDVIVNNEINVPEPVVNVTVENSVETPIVNIENNVEVPQTDANVTFMRDSDGNIIKANISE